MNKLRVIDFEKETSFEVKGGKYTVEPDALSFIRHKFFSALVVRLAYGRDYDSINTAINNAIGHMDKVQFVKAAVELNNIKEGIKSFPNRVNDAFAICALFINKEGEDRGTWSGEMIDQKIADWEGGGLSALPFQRLAATLCGNLLRDWKEMEGQGSQEKEV